MHRRLKAHPRCRQKAVSYSLLKAMYAPILVCYSFSFFLLILLLSRPYLCTVTISNIDVDVGAFFNDWFSNKFRLDDMPRGARITMNSDSLCAGYCCDATRLRCDRHATSSRLPCDSPIRRTQVARQSDRSRVCNNRVAVGTVIRTLYILCEGTSDWIWGREGWAYTGKFKAAMATEHSSPPGYT